MKILKVKTKPSYEIIIKENVFEDIPNDLKKNFNFGKIAIVTDHIVEDLYAKRLYKNLKKNQIKAEIFSFPAGEASKNMDTVISLARALIQKNFDRKDIIIALGGGVVGDVAGFLASIYLRGSPIFRFLLPFLLKLTPLLEGKPGLIFLKAKI
jgi:3-dehydroquinate synthetase